MNHKWLISLNSFFGQALSAGNDELANWVKARKSDGRFLDISDEATQKLFSGVAAKVQSGPFREPAKAEFLAKADPWLVARAKIAGATVVKHEKGEPHARRRVPLPNICDVFDVPYIDTYVLLRNHKASFGLMD